jgi:outer membrane protein assembly factor BamB
MNTRNGLGIFLSLAFTVSALAADWPQWRGPNRDGISAETGLLTTWPEGGPPLSWKAAGLGAGYSSVSISQGRIFTMGDGPDGSFVIALSENGGQKLWTTPVGSPGGGAGYPGPRCSPTVDGDLVFALGQHGDLVCLEAASGKERWRKKMSKDFGGKMMSGWGYSESPLVDGDRLICTPGGNQGTLLALDKKTGDVLWRTKPLTDSAAYSSVVPADMGKVHQYVQLTDAHVFGVAANDGRVLWEAARKGATAVVPTPIVYSNYVYVTSGYNVGCNLFRVETAGGGFRAEQVYANKALDNHHGGVIRIGEHIYGHSDRNGWVCQNLKSGEVVWSSKQLPKGALAYADGHFYLRSESGKGTVALIEAIPTAYREKGRFHQPDRSGANSWAHPVVANGKLYLRDQDILLCYDVKKP